MDVKGSPVEGSEGNQEFAIGNWGKQILVILAESLAELCPAVLWKAECVRDELEYQAEHISKQSVEGGVWFGLVSSCC